ncbi:hypothetical protein OG21DRAFT_1509537 [Imleria badia]|nr:hypothetical protein OG21DRAFT_1509537 [Imleria badia]
MVFGSGGRWRSASLAQLALEFSPAYHTLVVLPGDLSPPRFHWVPSNPGMVCEVPNPRSSPLAQDSSWSRTALRAAPRPHSHSITLVSVPVTARYGTRATPKRVMVSNSLLMGLPRSLHWHEST